MTNVLVFANLAIHERDLEPARLPTWRRRPVSPPQASLRCKDQFGGTLLPHALQAGVLGSQPSAPVTALTGDSAVCAFLKRMARQEMGAASGNGVAPASCPFFPSKQALVCAISIVRLVPEVTCLGQI
jgi:hypothetical protein